MKYDDLVNTTKSKGIHTILSGPFPDLFMSSETFSRVDLINRWLSNFAGNDHVSVINNFDSFWKDRHMFYPKSYTLSKKGAAQLTANIWRCLL